MSPQKYHTISSSEDDEEDVQVAKEIKPTEQKSNGGALKPEILEDIISKIKVVKYDFGELMRSSENSILYSNEITEDDEIWLVQAPRDVKLDALKTINPILGNSTQTLKVRKKEKRYNVCAIKSTSEEVNCVLPKKETESFHMNVYPIMGRIILQEDTQVESRDKDLDETSADPSVILESSVNNCTLSQISDIEEAPPLKKKKKSIKRDTV